MRVIIVDYQVLKCSESKYFQGEFLGGGEGDVPEKGRESPQKAGEGPTKGEGKGPRKRGKVPQMGREKAPESGERPQESGRVREAKYECEEGEQDDWEHAVAQR